MDIKQLGGILLITGNAIGGGMLALPIVVGPMGFIQSSLFLILCWAIMLAGALLILELSLWLPRNSHLVSMARATLGKSGEVVTWLCYLSLLYTLLSAYIAGGSDFLQGLSQKANFSVSPLITSILFVFGLGFITYRGIHWVDYINRSLMLCKLAIFFLLVSFLIPLVSFKLLAHSAKKYFLFPPGLTIIITSFGFSAIVPSLCRYFDNNFKQLRRIIIIGSLLPLFCYVFWNAVIVGIISTDKLSLIAVSKQPANYLAYTLQKLLNRRLITLLSWTFTSICLITSFLGVGISLTDFLMDGLKLKQTQKNSLFVHILSFFPPLILVLFYPNAFILALNYAGIWCASLLVLLPIGMVWTRRYHQKIYLPYQIIGGKASLSLLGLTTGLIVIHAIIVNIL